MYKLTQWQWWCGWKCANCNKANIFSWWSIVSNDDKAAQSHLSWTPVEFKSLVWVSTLQVCLHWLSEGRDSPDAVTIFLLSHTSLLVQSLHDDSPQSWQFPVSEFVTECQTCPSCKNSSSCFRGIPVGWCLLKTAFNEASVRSALISQGLGELFVKQLSQDPGAVHPDDTSSPFRLGSENHSFFNAG